MDIMKIYIYIYIEDKKHDILWFGVMLIDGNDDDETKTARIKTNLEVDDVFVSVGISYGSFLMFTIYAGYRDRQTELYDDTNTDYTIYRILLFVEWVGFLLDTPNVRRC